MDIYYDINTIHEIKHHCLNLPSDSWIFIDLDDTIWFDGTDKLVEPDMLQFINDIQNKNIHVMGLTARLSTTCDRTSKLLNELDIKFSQIFPETYYNLSKTLHDDAIFSKGVIYTSWSDKGKIVAHILSIAEKYNILPKNIGFIDDVYRNLASVYHVLHETNIKFLGIHYTAAKPKEHYYF